jgi:hypothetical protein
VTLQTLTDLILRAVCSPCHVCCQAPLAFQNSLTERWEVLDQGLPPIPSGK